MKKSSLVLSAAIAAIMSAQVMASPMPYPKTLSTYTSVPMRGVSLAGGAFDGYMQDNKFNDGVNPMKNFFPRKSDAKIFLVKGMNTVRIPIAWEYLVTGDDGLQPASGTYTLNTSDNSYWTGGKNTKGKFDGVLQLLAQFTMPLADTAPVNVILDLHNYMRFHAGHPLLDVSDQNPNDLSYVIGDHSLTGSKSAPTDLDFGTLWRNIAQSIVDHKSTINPNMISFELMNEPHDLGTNGNDIMVRNYLAAIKAIHTVYKNAKLKTPTIILDGRSWTGLHAWNTNNPTDNTKIPTGHDWLATLQSELGDENHDLELDVHQYFDKDYSGTHPTCVTKDELKVDTTFRKPIDTAINDWVSNFTTYRQAHTLHNGEAIPYILGEFGGHYGSEDNYQCATDIKDMLTDIGVSKTEQSNDPTSSKAAGFIWWSAGHAFNSEYPLNIAPGACYGNQYMYSDSHWDITNYLNQTGNLTDETFNIPYFSITNKSAGDQSDYPDYPMHYTAEGYPIDYTQATCNTLYSPQSKSPDAGKPRHIYISDNNGTAFSDSNTHIAQFGYYDSTFMHEYSDLGFQPGISGWFSNNGDKQSPPQKYVATIRPTIKNGLTDIADLPNKLYDSESFSKIKPETITITGNPKPVQAPTGGIDLVNKLGGDINGETQPTDKTKWHFPGFITCNDGTANCFLNNIATGNSVTLKTVLKNPDGWSYIGINTFDSGGTYASGFGLSFCKDDAGKVKVSFDAQTKAPAAASVTYNGTAILNNDKTITACQGTELSGSKPELDIEPLSGATH